jgi:heat shock protein HslJ
VVPSRRPSTHWPVAVGLGAIVVASIAACSSTASKSRNGSEEVANTEQQLMSNQWLLDRQSSSLRIGNSHPVTIVFAQLGQISGVAPCNTYRGTFVVHDNQTVTISRITTSGRPCQGQALAAENEYLHALQYVRNIQPTNRNELELTRGNTRLVYQATGTTGTTNP